MPTSSVGMQMSGRVSCRLRFLTSKGRVKDGEKEITSLRKEVGRLCEGVARTEAAEKEVVKAFSLAKYESTRWERALTKACVEVQELEDRLSAERVPAESVEIEVGRLQNTPTG